MARRALIVVLTLSIVRTAGLQPVRAWDLRVDAPPALAAAAARLERLDPAPLERALARAGLALPPAVRVTLVSESDDLARSQPRWIVGQAFASGDVRIFPDRVAAYPYDSLESVLWHEVVHVALSAQAGGRPLPRWFHEGVAVSVETGWRLRDRLHLLLDARRGPPISAVTALFGSGERSQSAAAYRQAAALVAHLRQTRGEAVPGAIAGRVSTGIPFVEAFVLETGLSPDEAATEAWKSYRALAVWVPTLTGATALWSAIVGLAAVAFAVQLRKRARQRRRWDDEDDLAG